MEFKWNDKVVFSISEGTMFMVFLLLITFVVYRK